MPRHSLNYVRTSHENLGGTEKSKSRSSEGISGRDAHVHDVRSVTSDARMLTTSTPFDSSESAVR